MTVVSRTAKRIVPALIMAGPDDVVVVVVVVPFPPLPDAAVPLALPVPTPVSFSGGVPFT